jgi:hypothetical protein
MRTGFPLLLFVMLLTGLRAADAPAKSATTPATKPTLKIIPGKVIVPTDAMRRPWGELISIDFKTRTGTFRNESTEEVMPFIVLPYSELLHHAAFGDLEDFRKGERVIFRLHQNDEGKWIWLTYIQDEMNMLNGHHEFFYVDRIDPAKGEIEYTQGELERKPPYIRAKGLILETDAETRYWKNGEPAKFADIKIGDKLRAKTHGIGSGKHHRAWEVFLDEASLQKFQKEQQAVHTRRMLADGLPGYVDAASSAEVKLTLFQEGRDLAKNLKVGQTVRVAAAGVDRKAFDAVEGTITVLKPKGNLNEVTIALKAAPTQPFVVAGVARLWGEPAAQEKATK